MPDITALPAEGDRLAKVIARSGLCSRRDAEGWIRDGRVTVNGKKVITPAFNVAASDRIKVDGEPLAERQGTRVWLYHKPPGLVVTEKDPEGRETIFEKLAERDLPRVVSIGRLDINTEGLLLLTNDGGLKRVLELPATGWLRRYRVRAFGSVTQAELSRLKDGIEIDGIQYGPIEAELEREQGSNVWLVLALREGKNREVKNVLATLGLQVNRLIRISFGPFQLGDLPVGEVEVVKARVLREQLGKRLADAAGADFDSDLPDAPPKKRAADPRLRAAAPGKAQPKPVRSTDASKRFRFEDDEVKAEIEPPPRRDRPGRPETKFAARPPKPEPELGPARKIHFTDGREPAEFRVKTYGKKPAPADGDEGKGGFAGKPGFGDKPKRAFDDKPRGLRPDGDRPRGPRPDGDRPRRDGAAPAYSGKPKRDYGDKPAGSRPARADGDRPARAFGAKPYGTRPPRPDGDRPARPYGDKPRTPRPDGDRPARSFGDKPRAPRPDGDRPARSFGDKPRGAKPFGDKARPPRADGDRPARSFGAKPYGSQSAGGKPAGTRPYGTRPPRPDGDRPARSFGDKTKAPRGIAADARPAQPGTGDNRDKRTGPRVRPRADGKPAAKRDGAAPRKHSTRPSAPRKPRS